MSGIACVATVSETVFRSLRVLSVRMKGFGNSNVLPVETVFGNSDALRF